MDFGINFNKVFQNGPKYTPEQILEIKNKYNTIVKAFVLYTTTINSSQEGSAKIECVENISQSLFGSPMPTGEDLLFFKSVIGPKFHHPEDLVNHGLATCETYAKDIIKNRYSGFPLKELD